MPIFKEWRDFFMLDVIENIENLTEEILEELQNGLEEGEDNE